MNHVPFVKKKKLFLKQIGENIAQILDRTFWSVVFIYSGFVSCQSVYESEVRYDPLLLCGSQCLSVEPDFSFIVYFTVDKSV